MHSLLVGLASRARCWINKRPPYFKEAVLFIITDNFLLIVALLENLDKGTNGFKTR